MIERDVLVIGGGIAGASIAYHLAQTHQRRVTVLEREPHCGVHSTGRSAALFMETYGTPLVRALTVGSRAFYEHPPAGFAEHPLLTPRGSMHAAFDLGDYDPRTMLDQEYDAARLTSREVRRLDRDEALALCPVLDREALVGAVYEPGAMDMDVHAIHEGFLRGARRAGAQVRVNQDIRALERKAGQWQIETADGRHAAPVVVNAAGAWAEQVGRLAGAQPIGLVPKRRSAFVFAAPAGLAFADWPLVIGADEGFYFKPDAGMLLGSPANADPVEPHDVQAEELDIATAIWRIEQVSSLRIRRPTRVWAGLRSFVADGDLVGGFDPDLDGFFWLAAQGGYGIQTAEGMARACAALIAKSPMPDDLAQLGVSAQALSPGRLRTASRA